MDKVTGSDPVDGSSILPKRAIKKNKIFFTVDTFICELYIILPFKLYIENIQNKQCLQKM